MKLPHFYAKGRREILTKAVFITATGTDVGKTYISGLLVKKMRELGYNCGYYKPALSGAVECAGEIIPGDCDYVLKQAGISAPASDYVSYIFKPAVYPHLAAQIENNPIRLNKNNNQDVNLKEEKLMLPDVIKALGLDILVVASASLGTINSTVLTVEYAKQQGINVKGIILNNYNKDDMMQVDNKNQVENLTGINVVETVADNQDDLKINNIESVFEEV